MENKSNLSIFFSFFLFPRKPLEENEKKSFILDIAML